MMSIEFGDFLDSEGYIRPDLLDKEAQDVAKQLKAKKLTTHQVRKFYDEVKNYKTRIDKGDDFRKIKPLIVMLKSKAKYAATRKNEMYIFYDFIEKSVNKINEADEIEQKAQFDAFCLFFEAVYGFAELKS
jgi:CRISPR-associated protein Csm2